MYSIVPLYILYNLRLWNKYTFRMCQQTLDFHEEARKSACSPGHPQLNRVSLKRAGWVWSTCHKSHSYEGSYIYSSKVQVRKLKANIVYRLMLINHGWVSHQKEYQTLSTVWWSSTLGEPRIKRTADKDDPRLLSRNTLNQSFWFGCIRA